MRLNISIVYALVALRHTWFWLGIWVYYYLRLTNYAGIGIIETCLFLSMTLSEIPTGAFADLFGKRITLIISFIFQAVGLYVIAFTPNFTGLLGGVLLAGIGTAFYSGTIDALAYDSLKQDKDEPRYKKVVANMSSIGLVLPAISSILGGYLYTVQPNLPFLFNAISYSLAVVLCLFITEPKIDTEKYSMRSFFRQTKQGFAQLFEKIEFRRYVVLLLSIAFIVVVCDEMLDSFLAVEFAFTPIQISILWSVIYLLSAGASQIFPFLHRRISNFSLIVYVGILFALTLIVSPFVGMFVGGITLLIRYSLQAIFSNISSVIINENTESSYRATTLSTFNLIKTIPYVLFAYILGKIADAYSAVMIAEVLGLLLILFLVLQLFSYKKFMYDSAKK